MELPKSFLSGCGWLKTGDRNNDLVISSRIRLARNIEGFPFSQWASSSDLKRIAEQVREAINHSACLRNANLIAIEELESVDRHFLAERYMISQELAKSGIERYVAINPEQTSALMINEEDHIRLQVLMAGSNLNHVWNLISSIDGELEESLDFCFSNTFGYLTACPTNVGTGIRCSVMVHLPALVITRKIEKVLSAVTQIGLTVRGLSGEGSDIAGNLFQISNQWTLGISEKETIEKIGKILHQIVEQERLAQKQMMDDNRVALEDKIWRAYALLRYAKVISSNEAVELLSSIRFGRNMGILKAPSYEQLNEMLIQVRPAHLQKRAGKQLTMVERDEYRAELIRGWMENGQSTA
ncbi:MAG: protein arginine kinase [Candidatus Omnitrophota bacterium]|jgi:protein arginine kinase|nr:MAG: protein arginine kinase [Candidatus Omnitrophota bacterium]